MKTKDAVCWFKGDICQHFVSNSYSLALIAVEFVHYDFFWRYLHL